MEIKKKRNFVALGEKLVNNNNNNKNILYSSQREIKAVVRSQNEEHNYLNNAKSLNTHIHTLRQTPPFSEYANTNSKPKISWNNAFSDKPKHKNSQIK